MITIQGISKWSYNLKTTTCFVHFFVCCGDLVSYFFIKIILRSQHWNDNDSRKTPSGLIRNCEFGTLSALRTTVTSAIIPLLIARVTCVFQNRIMWLMHKDAFCSVYPWVGAVMSQWFSRWDKQSLFLWNIVRIWCLGLRITNVYQNSW